MNRVRVLVVDDVDLFRTGLSAALGAAGFDICGEAGNAEGAVTAAESLLPDVVVLDILMPGLSGLEVVEKILAVSPSSRIILLTASESVEDLLEGIRAGARGYLVKDTAFEGLATAIQEVVRGGAAVSARMGGKLFDILRQSLRHQELIGDRQPSLTGREIEVLRHVARGETSRDIGRVLYISENTVKNHIRNILDKLGLHSRNEAVLYAIRENLIEL
jgi:DNA-binding NarL/FixJ family response regulator